ncbi:hypothetical protein D3C75_523570 [compost metagenome]
MRLREHVLDLLTGINVPCRHIALLHFVLPFLAQTAALPHAFGNFEGQACIHTRFINEIEHDVVPAANNRFDGAGAVFDQFLGIAQPNSRSMGQTGNLQQVGKGGRLGFLQHLADELGTHFGHAIGGYRGADLRR